MAFDISKFAEATREPAAGRDIEAITTEILRLKQDAGNAILGIGQRLIEAKAMLSHGEWLPWLTERVEFSERQAQRFMRLAQEWADPQALVALGSTKALTLLALPPEERERFMVENHVVDGEEKTVIDMTSRELEKAVKEREGSLNMERAGTSAKQWKKAEELATVRKQMEEAQQAEYRSIIDSCKDLAMFEMLLSQGNEVLIKLHRLLLKVRGRGDPELARKLRNALLALADATRRCAE